MLGGDLRQVVARSRVVETRDPALQERREEAAITFVDLSLCLGLLCQFLPAVLGAEAVDMVATGQRALDEAFVHQGG